MIFVDKRPPHHYIYGLTDSPLSRIIKEQNHRCKLSRWTPYRSEAPTSKQNNWEDRANGPFFYIYHITAVKSKLQYKSILFSVIFKTAIDF